MVTACVYVLNKEETFNNAYEKVSVLLSWRTASAVVLGYENTGFKRNLITGDGATKSKRLSVEGLRKPFFVEHINSQAW